MTITTGRFLAMASMVALALATQAEAQDRPVPPTAASSSAGQDDDGLTEIVVTARRVAENQQTVPVSLTAISGEGIRDRDIRTSTDLQRFVPSLNVTAGLSRNAETFSIRGQRETANIAGGGATTDSARRKS